MFLNSEMPVVVALIAVAADDEAAAVVVVMTSRDNNKIRIYLFLNIRYIIVLSLSNSKKSQGTSCDFIAACIKYQVPSPMKKPTRTSTATRGNFFQLIFFLCELFRSTLQRLFFVP